MPRLRPVHRRWGHRPQHGNQLARGPQGDLMRHSIRCALAGAAASAGIIALAACPASAAVTSQAHHTSVPCDTAALDSAISSAANGDTLVLAAGCTYQTGGLPEISTNLAIVGRGGPPAHTLHTPEAPIT